MRTARFRPAGVDDPAQWNDDAHPPESPRPPAPTPRAGRDPLTGLLDRTQITSILDDLSPEDASARGIGVVFVDLDRFKPVNDVYGHGAGDDVLRVVAQRLQGHIRPGDTLARFGGDEFVVVCQGTDAPALDALAQRLVAEVASPIETAGTTVTIGASAGTAFAGDVVADLSLLEQADLAMYLAKSEHLGVVPFSARVAKRLLARTAARTDLDTAMRSGAARSLIRPIRAAASRRTVAFESQMQWVDGDVVIDAPALRARATELAMLPALIAHEIGAACEAEASLMRAGHHPQPVRALVSVRGSQITEPSIATAIREAVLAGHLLGGRLGLLVDGAGRWDGATVVPILRELSRLGVSLGVSSLTATELRDAVDIWSARVFVVDDALVTNIGESLRDREVLRAQIELGHALGVHVMARCEDKETADTAVRLGVDLVGGGAAGAWVTPPRTPSVTTTR